MNAVILLRYVRPRVLIDYRPVDVAGRCFCEARRARVGRGRAPPLLVSDFALAAPSGDADPDVTAPGPGVTDDRIPPRSCPAMELRVDSELSEERVVPAGS